MNATPPAPAHEPPPDARAHDALPVPPPARRLDATVPLPGSKSITNRALILAALADGETLLTGALFSRDTRIMAAALRALGFDIRADEAAATIRVTGLAGKIPAARATLHLGNAGTAARFLPALLALRPDGEYRLECDAAMTARPMSGLFAALETQGSRLTAADGTGAPARALPCIQRTSGLRGGEIHVNAAASSQILSALLMVAPLAATPARVILDGETVSHPFVTMTLRMMAQFSETRGTGGSPVNPSPVSPPARIHTGEIPRGPYRAPATYAIEPDATAASYFFALPIATPATIRIHGLPADSLQGDIAFLDILRRLGLPVRAHGISAAAASSPADIITATPVRPLSGGDFDFNAISDTFLTLAALAPLLSSPLTLRNIAHARRQETDRVLAVATELERLGQRVSPTAAQLRADPSLGDITIFPDLAALRRLTARAPILVRTYDDHRIAMSFGILALHPLHPDRRPWLLIENPACTSKTFPAFFPLLLSLGT